MEGIFLVKIFCVHFTIIISGTRDSRVISECTIFATSWAIVLWIGCGECTIHLFRCTCLREITRRHELLEIVTLFLPFYEFEEERIYIRFYVPQFMDGNHENKKYPRGRHECF